MKTKEEIRLGVIDKTKYMEVKNKWEVKIKAIFKCTNKMGALTDNKCGEDKEIDLRIAKGNKLRWRTVLKTKVSRQIKIRVYKITLKSTLTYLRMQDTDNDKQNKAKSGKLGKENFQEEFSKENRQN